MAEDKWDADEEWKRIPGATAEDVVQPTLDEGAKKERDEWCMMQRRLDGAPDLIRSVSWHLFNVTGIEPYGTKKAWIGACNALWEATGQSDAVLVAALTKGNEVRIERGLTMSGPRSFIKFAIDARSRATLQGRRHDAAPGESGGGKLHHGQRIVGDKIVIG